MDRVLKRMVLVTSLLSATSARPGVIEGHGGGAGSEFLGDAQLLGGGHGGGGYGGGYGGGGYGEGGYGGGGYGGGYGGGFGDVGGGHGLQLVDLSSGGGFHHGAALLALGGGGHGIPLGQPELVELGPVGEPSVQIIEADVPPPKTIRVTKTVAVGVPVPYPVRNDVPVPVHVPQAVPVPVHVPVHIPAPPPLPAAVLSAPAGDYGSQGSYGPSGGGIAASASGLSGVSAGSYGASAGGYGGGGGDYSGGSGSGGAGLDAAAALAAAGINHSSDVGLAEAHTQDLGAAASGGNSEDISRSATAIVGEETIQRAIDAAEAIEQGNKVPEH